SRGACIDRPGAALAKRAEHQQLPLAGKPCGIAQTCLRGKTDKPGVDSRQRVDARCGRRGRAITPFEQGTHEETALVIVRPEPLAEDIEDREESRRGRASALVDLVLEPV